MLALAACTPTTGNDPTEAPSSTGGSVDPSAGETAIQTVTGVPETTLPSTTESATDPSTVGETVEPTSSTTSSGVCGNGVLEGGEDCDDGNTDDQDGCTQLCRAPFCGDGIVHPGEDCDDGDDDNADECTQVCAAPKCGDGFVQGDEGCDDGNDDNTDACIDGCVPASCGDGYLQEDAELCDDGFNDASYGGCMPGCAELGPHCGDGKLDKVDPQKPKGFEYCDGATSLTGVDCTGDCLYDFASVPQLFCTGTCSWGVTPGCGKDDADVFCQLRTGNAASTATSYTVGDATDQGGFPCADANQFIELDGKDPRIDLGPMPEFGQPKKVYYQLTKIKSSHGTKSVIVGSTLKCTP